MFIPIFGLVANLACMAFYLIGPFMGYGTKMEPLLALGIAAGMGDLWRDLLRPGKQKDRTDNLSNGSQGRSLAVVELCE